MKHLNKIWFFLILVGVILISGCTGKSKEGVVPTPVTPTVPTTNITTTVTQPTTPKTTTSPTPTKCATKPTLTLSKTSWNAGEEVIATATTNDPNCAGKEVYFTLSVDLNTAGLMLACAEVRRGLNKFLVTADKNGNAQCTFKFSHGERFIRAVYVTTGYYGDVYSFAGNLVSNPVQVTVS